MYQSILVSVNLLAETPRLWYALPLILVVSLVYGATRHENLKEILVQSSRSAVWVIAFMSIIFFLIWVAGYWN
ncbi:MAG: hypothetical protein AAF939_04070 [Planctomycetota bacterium]